MRLPHFWLGAVVCTLLLAGCTGIPVVTPVASSETPVGSTIPQATAVPAEEVATTGDLTTTEEITTTEETTATAQGITYDDPFAYCAAVGTVDQPDARYTGPEAPESIAAAMRTIFEQPDASLDVYQRTLVWRCVDSQVYGCIVGANLPCAEKANTSEEPTEAMTGYCQENAGSDFIPAYITGHNTIYSWRCEGESAVVDSQVFQVDEQGFISDIWYPIPSAE